MRATTAFRCSFVAVISVLVSSVAGCLDASARALASSRLMSVMNWVEDMTSDISSLRTAESESTRRESTWAMVASCCLVSVLQPASTAADSMATGTTLMSLTGGTTWLKETRSFGALKATVMPLTFLRCKSLVQLVLHHRRALGVYDRLGGIGNLYPEFHSVFVGSQAQPGDRRPRVEGRGSRVEGRGARVEGRGSRVEGRGVERSTGSG